MDDFNIFGDLIPDAIQEQIKEMMVAESNRVFQDCLKKGLIESAISLKVMQAAEETKEIKLFLCSAKTRHKLLSEYPFMVHAASVRFVVYDFIEDGEVYEITDEETKRRILHALGDSEFIGFKGNVK